MIPDAMPKDYAALVQKLRKSREGECLEFKGSDAEPQKIGEYLSALANSAACNDKDFAYLVWGIEDKTHRVVGTSFSPSRKKKGNEPLETWLQRLLTPKIYFQFHELTLEDKSVVLLKVARAFQQPVRFEGKEFIRIGSATKALKDAPERERMLWRMLDRTPFEHGIALEQAQADDVLQRLNCHAYFKLLKKPLPANRDAILDALAGDNLVKRSDAGGWNITNLGAILFAEQLDDFAGLRRKAVRVIQYQGASRVKTLKEKSGIRGYAVGFENLTDYINGLLPSNEVIEKTFRNDALMFPGLAIRELAANALIHQDFFITGAGPMVEIFDDRIEITSPGEPLVDTRRFVDAAPQSRNEGLASLMRRFGICEERGSGIDKVVSEVEFYQLPAPLFEAPQGCTRCVLFAHKPLSKMNKDDRIRACYLHSCLRYVNQEPTTNKSVRERFNISDKNNSIASRLLHEAVEAEVIVIADPDAGTKARTYLPYWAAPEESPTEFA